MLLFLKPLLVHVCRLIDSVVGQTRKVVNVKDYGARGDGTDATKVKICAPFRFYD